MAIPMRKGWDDHPKKLLLAFIDHLRPRPQIVVQFARVLMQVRRKNFQKRSAKS
jgi:hypothetical protein